MLDHVVELLGLLRMALFHCGNNVHHSAACLSGSKLTPGSEKDQLGDIAIIESNAAPVRSAVFPNL